MKYQLLMRLTHTANAVVSLVVNFKRHDGCEPDDRICRSKRNAVCETLRVREYDSVLVGVLKEIKNSRAILCRCVAIDGRMLVTFGSKCCGDTR